MKGKSAPLDNDYSRYQEQGFEDAMLMIDELRIRINEIKEFSSVSSRISGDELHVVGSVVRGGKVIICNCSRF